MDNSGTEICAICHEDMETDIYSLPECTHKYHTNCIMHWFRAGHNTCPLCNNTGINNIHTGGDHTIYYGMREAALENYKRIRRLARKKNADPDLLAQIKRIKKKEATNKKKRDKWREYKNEVLVGGKTRRQIHAEWLRAHRKSWSWRIRNELDNMKIALGLQYIKPLIVATKVNID